MRAKKYRLTSAPANSNGIYVIPISEVSFAGLVFIPIGDILTYKRKFQLAGNFMSVFEHNDIEVAFTESQASNLTGIRMK